jgi:hypothetical protein
LSFDNTLSKQQEPNPNAALVKLVVAAGSQGERAVAAVQWWASAPFVEMREICWISKEEIKHAGSA